MKASESTVFEATIKQDRLILVGGLMAVTGISWLWIVVGAGMNMDALEMTRMSALGHNRTFGHFVRDVRFGVGSRHPGIRLLAYESTV